MSRRDLNITTKIQHEDYKNIVLFHGWGFDNNIFNSLELSLIDKFNIYKVDLPGFGLSSQMDWESFTEILSSRLPDSFILFGWSMGGLFATKVAISFKDRVSHLINVASSPKFIREEGWPGIDDRVFQNFYTELVKNKENALTEFINLQLKESEVDRNLLLNNNFSIDALKNGLSILREWDLREHISKLTIPVAYMYGKRDAIVPMRLYKYMQKYYPDFQYNLFNKSAHVPFISEMDLFVDTISSFTNT